MKLAFTAKDYEYLFGADAAAERKLAQQARSTHQGKFEKRLARVKSAVENFIPEVCPGNQTALNTRAAPFAAYIARMHRSIHELWGFGQLEEWDEKSGSSPFNNQNLVTELEIVLNGDGTVDRVGVVRTSGLTAYDVAAVDVVYSAGPTPIRRGPSAPRTGRSISTGTFYRDGRQCSPAFADPYILENASAAADKTTALDVPRPGSLCRDLATNVRPGRADRDGCSGSTTTTPSTAPSAPRSTERSPPPRPGAVGSALR